MGMPAYLGQQRKVSCHIKLEDRLETLANVWQVLWEDEPLIWSQSGNDRLQPPAGMYAGITSPYLNRGRCCTTRGG